MRFSVKQVPNILSGSRIILALSLLLFTPFSVEFMTIYVIAGLTDLLDGLLAKKLNCQSAIGANLDGAADLLLAGVVLWMLLPVMVMPGWATIVVLSILGIRLVSALVAYARFREFVMLHTLANKVTAVIAFLFPVLYIIMPTDILLAAACFVAFIAFSEDLLINATAQNADRNIKGLLFRKDSRL